VAGPAGGTIIICWKVPLGVLRPAGESTLIISGGLSCTARVTPHTVRSECADSDQAAGGRNDSLIDHAQWIALVAELGKGFISDVRGRKRLFRYASLKVTG